MRGFDVKTPLAQHYTKGSVAPSQITTAGGGALVLDTAYDAADSSETSL